jgi:hypothetical protein
VIVVPAPAPFVVVGVVWVVVPPPVPEAWGPSTTTLPPQAAYTTAIQTQSKKAG